MIMTKKIKTLVSISMISLTVGLTNLSGIVPHTLEQVEAASRGGTHRGTIYYFPRCNSSFTSIVDALKSIGFQSDYAYRKRIAIANGIYNYTGTASQNIALLNLLKSGRLILGIVSCR